MSELRSVLESWGFSVANDRNRDLYIYDKHGRITALMEVKTDATLSSTYTAVGQLLLNTVGISPAPHLIFVAPSDLSGKAGAALSELRIEVWKYRLSGDDVRFVKLNRAIAAASAGT